MPKQFKTRKELQEQLNQWDEFVKKYDADKAKNDKEVSDLDKKRASLQSLIEKKISTWVMSQISFMLPKKLELNLPEEGDSAGELYNYLKKKTGLPRLSVKSKTIFEKTNGLERICCKSKKSTEDSTKHRRNETVQRDEQERHRRAKEFLQQSDNLLNKNRECRRKTEKVWKNSRELATPMTNDPCLNVPPWSKGIAQSSRFVPQRSAQSIISTKRSP